MCENIAAEEKFMVPLLLIGIFALQPMQACTVERAPSEARAAEAQATTSGSAPMANLAAEDLEPGAIVERGTPPARPTTVQRSTHRVAESEGWPPSTVVVFRAPAAQAGRASDRVVERASAAANASSLDC